MKIHSGVLSLVLFAITACNSELPQAPEPQAGDHGVVDSIPGPQRPSEFRSATDFYGPLYVTEGEFEAESKIKPWSSWWFPTKETVLFQSQSGRLSPLEKYDLFAQRVRNGVASAANYEREYLYDPDASTWEGLCNAWAAASLYEPEPTASRIMKGIEFSVGDQKAVLIKSYEEVEGLHPFGQRYQGDRVSVFDDIYPDQFHRVVQAELIQNGRPFIMDKDPGVPVWNTPVWKAQGQITRDPSDANLLHVDLWLTGASPFVDTYDFVGTLSVAFEYTYDLYGQQQPDGTWEIEYGVWTGRSMDFHPDFVTVLPEKPKHASKNRNLDPDVVSAIFAGN